MRISASLLLATLFLAFASLGSPVAAQAQTPGAENDLATMVRNLNEGRIAFIATSLNLSEAQKPLWEPIADLLRQEGEALAMEQDNAKKNRDQGLGDLLDDRAGRLEQQAAIDRKLAGLLKALEAELSDEQRETLKLAFFATRLRSPQMLNRAGQRWLSEPDLQ